MKCVIAVLCVLAVAAVANARSIEDVDDVELSTRIVNGHNSTRGQFPHQALIFLNLPEGRQDVCGGSLISTNWILTAGHCVDGVESFEVHLGALETRNFTERGRQIRRTNTSVLHPYYWRPIVLNDIALIRLDTPVEFSDTIQAIDLPPRRNPFHGITAIASGFGLQNTSAPTIAPILQWANLNTIDNAQCYKSFGFLVARSSVICAVGTTGQSACNGDSGGPLITEDGIQIGLTSFGSGEGCHRGYPSVFTRVSYYLDWIAEVTGVETSTDEGKWW